jgi:hypothetical protein
MENALSMLIKFATITARGPPVLALAIFEVLLNTTATSNNRGNIRLPAELDRVLRLFVVTLGRHRRPAFRRRAPDRLRARLRAP